MSPVAEGWRRAGRPDGGLSLQPSLRGFDGDTTRCSRAGDTAWAPGCSAGRTAGSAGLRRRNAQLRRAMQWQDPLKEQRVPRRPAGLLADRTLSPALLPSLTHTPPPVILHVPCRPSTPRPASARSSAIRSSTLCHPPFITPRSSTWGLTSCTWRSTWKTWRAPCAPSARSPAFAGSAARSPTRSPSSGIPTTSNPPPGASAQTVGRTIPNAQGWIHCTPVGMSPNAGETFVPDSLLTPRLTVMDIVYNPLETRLLKEASRAGCRTIRGLEMFLQQAAGQFELWTQQPAPVEIMRAILEKQLT